MRGCVRPGLTGWAQVNIGYTDESPEGGSRKLRYDLFYIRYRSVWLDLIILFKTVRIVLTGFGSR
jgi:lipopolysaccharide/colanic/teichoic acid biosynthesis glycosyltransferase